MNDNFGYTCFGAEAKLDITRKIFPFIPDHTKAWSLHNSNEFVEKENENVEMRMSGLY